MSELYDSIMRGLQEVADDVSGRKPLPATKISVIPVKVYSADEIKSIRHSTGLSQVLFAEYLGVSPKTVEAWESGRNHPAGSSSRILSMIEADSTFTKEYPFVRIEKCITQ